MKSCTKIFFLCLFFLVFNANAQQDAQFSHFMFNQLYTNAGYAGIEGLSRGTLIHRSQWLGYSGIDPGIAPTSQALTVSHPLKLMKSPVVNSGAGLVLLNDKLGPWKIMNIKAAYSYHLKFSNGGTLGMGLKAGIFYSGIDGGVLRSSEEDDAVVTSLQNSPAQVKPDFDMGFWYTTKKYFAGISMNHLTKSSFNYKQDNIQSQLYRHMYITGGYNFQITPEIVVTPTAIIQTDFAETNFNYGAIGVYGKHKYWGGFTLRQSISANPVGPRGRQWINDDLIFLLGIGLLEDNSLRIGYSFDLVTSGPRAKNYTSHELMLSYVLPFGADVKPPPLRTPRYRHEN